MVIFNDIYNEVDSRILQQGFWNVDIESKKKLIDQALKEYIVLKIKSLNWSEKVTAEDMCLGVVHLLQMLANIIPKEEHFDTLRHLTHYILQVAGNLQSYSVTWWVEDEEELIESPLVEFNDKGLWNDLKTHKQTDYVKTFEFTYNVFQNKFQKEDSKKFILEPLESE